jgi:hypothetical protein
VMRHDFKDKLTPKMTPPFGRQKAPHYISSTGTKSYFHAPGETRTPNLLIRSQMLYPIELRAHKQTWAVQDSNL